MGPFFGYPGGKSKVAKRLISGLKLSEVSHNRYVEPCAGGFSVGLCHLEQCPGKDVWLNDFDPDVFCLWVAALEYTDYFCERINDAKITSDDFFTLKKKLMVSREAPTTKKAIVSRALNKLIVHKISFSNMGEMSGSPVGGRDQTGKWKFDCRWNPSSIESKIRKVANLLPSARITNLSYEDVLSECVEDDLVYIDPPYVVAGKKCYKHSFDASQHRQLRDYCTSLKSNWFMTYDNHPDIRELYSQFNVDDLSFKYWMSTRGRHGKEMKEGKELLIYNFN